MGSAQRLAAFEEAFRRFLEAVVRLPEDALGEKLETTTPRDLLARLISWNRLVHDGCKDLGVGHVPAYFSEAESEYAQVQAEALRHLGPFDRKRLTEELTTSKGKLSTYLSGLEPSEWNRDRGLRHPEGGRATVLRELEGLTRRYLDATDEISLWLETRSQT